MEMYPFYSFILSRMPGPYYAEYNLVNWYLSIRAFTKVKAGKKTKENENDEKSENVCSVGEQCAWHSLAATLVLKDYFTTLET